ncbi:MAG: amino acid permease [Oligoflexales bacterium]|nr:amino acid permease [Oligoflexales bacterium]
MASGQKKLKRSLRLKDLLFIGIGCIIGVGIFILPGTEAAKNSGPGIILSFVIAGVAASFTALSYAELASMTPSSGSAYTYGYAALGEILAWIIGWELILEYLCTAVLVALGWSAYFSGLMINLGISLPQAFVNGPLSESPGHFNVPAAAIILVLTALLTRGTEKGAKFNMTVVILKVLAIMIFVAIGARHINPQNWTPFLPFGFSGALASAGVVFLAYVGFDAVSTTAEEAVNPQRDMPIGIIGSLVVATLLYVAVAIVMTGVIPYNMLGVSDPMNVVLMALRQPFVAIVISLGAMAGITSVLLVLLISQPRIFFTMARDGLLPPGLARLHPKHGTPYITTWITGILAASIAGVSDLAFIANLCSIGTLLGFCIVSAGVILLRYTKKDLYRGFRVPFFPLVPLAGISLCVLLMYSRPLITWLRLVTWLSIGLIIYFCYGYRHSKLSKLNLKSDHEKKTRKEAFTRKDVQEPESSLLAGNNSTVPEEA